ncbi:ethanolamine utilization protein [Desulfosporosinus orientis DSM 765]|uniref:Ethanolamine utilization protein n=1 Tax=Desulfosporosinus orientis (strain ATCC 19365 / DSM 765 / NCIMB 8382 / VKM B-1628 / Singapore I) TaxID=768706 RepID=G7WEV6_DESOD|nr:cupin domain-containing protein [Desulfosporosinus orientis]AET67285.1 ethanolamine utilization protein [Desulfosporosinus orientis DSM 765]
MGRFISAAVLRDMAKLNKTVVLEEDSVLTPSAKDLAKELGITICKGREEIVGHNVVGQSAGQKQTPAVNSAEAGNQSEDLKKAVQKILGEVLKPACENPKATHVKGETVVVQPFLEAPPGQKVGLVDVIDSRVGNLASGFMTFDHSQLPWFLNYDEVDYVIEGEFVLEVAGQVFRAKAGDVVYIPKGSQVVFSSPTFCKVFYCTYPANWADFCD